MRFVGTFQLRLRTLLGYDDSLDVVGVHGVGGLVGTLLAAVVAVGALGGSTPKVSEGEVYSWVSQLGTQALGAIFTVVFTAVVTIVILLIIKHTVGLRVDESEESIGLDQSAHGETAYND